jgi:hypothetical protein
MTPQAKHGEHKISLMGIEELEKRSFKQGYAKCKADVEKIIDEHITLFPNSLEEPDVKVIFPEELKQSLAKLNHSQQSQNASIGCGEDTADARKGKEKKA